MSLAVYYVVLYVDNAELCRSFWVEKVGMVEQDRRSFGEHVIVKVGFADQLFSFELVPLAMMGDNPDGLDFATPSVALRADDLEAARANLVSYGVTVTEIGNHGGARSFGFSDPEGRWFAVTS